MRAKLLLSVVFCIAIGVVGAALLTLPSPSPTTSVVPPPQTASSSVTTTAASSSQTTVASKYSMVNVAKHNSASSCWTAINGKVYDLTNWINQHPGGPGTILSICGTDGSAAFNNQHGGQNRPANELTNFLLGPLTQ